MDIYKIAFDMYKNEHSRWSTWTVFYFGSIISVFTLYSQVKAFIPIWLPLTLSALLSVAWIFVCLSIRASTQTWRKVLQHLEDNPGVVTYNNLSLIAIFDNKKTDFKKWTDFMQTFTFEKVNGERTFSSVTRLLTFQGVLFTLLFIALLLLNALGVGKELNQHAEEEKYRIYRETVGALSLYAIDAMNPSLQSNKKQDKTTVLKPILRPSTYEELERSRSMVQAFFSKETYAKIDKVFKILPGINGAPNAEFEIARTEAVQAMTKELGIIY